MKRILSTTIASAVVALGTLAVAQPAQAITNPADNPRPITVKGDDGKTYTDGEDTLPGYDDEACTYIPGAYFDFDNNRVRYADGQSIAWTEWDRATGYKEWQAKKSKPAATPTTAAPKATTPKPAKTTAAPKATTPKATAKPAAAAKKTATSSATPSATTATPSATPSATEPTVAAAAADDTTDAPTDTTSDTTSDATETPADETQDVTLASESADTTQAAADDSGTGSAGVLILGGLVGAGALAYAGYTVVNRRKGSAA